MAIFTELDEQISALRGLLGADAAADDLGSILSALSDDRLIDAVAAAAALARYAERVSTAGAGVLSARSMKETGQAGLAQSRGHRTPVTLVQELTGESRAEAAKRVRVGQALVETSLTAEVGQLDIDHDGETTPSNIWHAPLDEALLAGRISTTQHEAILRGLGEPPEPFIGSDSREEAEALRAASVETWAAAAEQLVHEAAQRTVEELRSAARTIRDQLDPEGAERRFLQRYESRSYRMWTDADGRHHGSFLFDDEGYLWVRSVVDAALRPRRGGPRFVDAEEKAAARDLTEDPRTNDQLAYDLMLDVLRAGGLADAEAVFGTRQAGVRIVHVAGAPTAHSEDGLIAFPAAVAEQRICDAGATVVAVDSCGKPLDVGREQRLFTSRQRIALSVRDGGCRWRGCDRPASYCEAHHIDEWSGGGRTDVDRGILLCRFHHANLHHHGWWIARDGTDEFVLHHPDGETFVLERRLVLAYAFADPPPRRLRPAA